MKKILGLDIGTNSIGWALVHKPILAGETYTIAGMGVRIIPLSSDENDEFTKGNACLKTPGARKSPGPGVFSFKDNRCGKLKYYLSNIASFLLYFY